MVHLAAVKAFNEFLKLMPQTLKFMTCVLRLVFLSPAQHAVGQMQSWFL